MKIKSGRDFWSGLIFIGVGTAFAAGAASYGFGTSNEPGPGYLPYGLGILLALLGLLITVKSLTIATLVGEPVGQIAWRPLVLVLGSIILFAFLLPRAGMFISLPILVITSALAGDEFHLHEVLASATVLTVGSWLIFIKGLGVAIPLLPAFMLG